MNGQTYWSAASIRAIAVSGEHALRKLLRPDSSKALSPKEDNDPLLLSRHVGASWKSLHSKCAREENISKANHRKSHETA